MNKSFKFLLLHKINLVLLLSVLVFVPITTFAQSSIQINNETDIRIIIEPQNNTKLEEILEKLTEKDNSNWNHGDVLLSSATILAFLGFGTFFAMRFRSDRPEVLFRLITGILLSAYLIEILHLYIMLSVVLDYFSELHYQIVIYVTIALLTIVIASMIRINDILTRKKETGLVDKELDETISIYLSRKTAEIQDKEERIHDKEERIQTTLDTLQNNLNQIKDDDDTKNN